MVGVREMEMGSEALGHRLAPLWQLTRVESELRAGPSPIQRESDRAQAPWNGNGRGDPRCYRFIQVSR